MKYNIFFFLLICLTLISCSRKVKHKKHLSPQYVEVREQHGCFQLYRNGAPYFIKGACIYNTFNLLKISGGNSLRIYNVNADSALSILNRAQKEGITVTVGLNVADGGSFDYSDENAVTAQLERIKKDVLRLKNHPALLMWGIGNELNLKLEFTQIIKHFHLWRNVNKIAKMVHDLDPNHPTTTMIPSDSKKTMRLISLLCDEIDILSINVFRKMPDLPQVLANHGWSGPYLVSEYGTSGHWLAPRSDWYAKVEPTSFLKAQIIQTQYKELIDNNKAKCLGSYVFIWGQKQEYTTTWFSLFTQSGQPTEMTDALQYIWSNKWPINRAPSIASLEINQKKDKTSAYLQANRKFIATLTFRDIEDDSLQMSWEIQKDDVEIYFDSTLPQSKPETIARGKLNLGTKKNKNITSATEWQKFQLLIKAPPKEGAYRLFIYLTDVHKKVATSNAVFYVVN